MSCLRPTLYAHLVAKLNRPLYEFPAQLPSARRDILS